MTGALSQCLLNVYWAASQKRPRAHHGQPKHSCSTCHKGWSWTHPYFSCSARRQHGCFPGIFLQLERPCGARSLGVTICSVQCLRDVVESGQSHGVPRGFITWDTHLMHDGAHDHGSGSGPRACPQLQHPPSCHGGYEGGASRTASAEKSTHPGSHARHATADRLRRSGMTWRPTSAGQRRRRRPPPPRPPLRPLPPPPPSPPPPLPSPLSPPPQPFHVTA